MGSDQSRDNTNKQFDDLLQKYQKESEIKSQHFDGSIVVYTNQANQKLFVNKILCKSGKDVQQAAIFFRNRVSHQNLFRLLGVKYIKQAEVCGDMNVLQVAYEYFDDNLGSELIERQMTNSYFTESHIWVLIQQLVDPCIHLLKHSQIHGDIRPTNIFLDQEGSVKTIDCNMFPNGKSNIHRVLLHQEAYPSPQQLSAIKKQDLKQFSQKSDVYSLGMTILECMTLQCKKKEIYKKKYLQLPLLAITLTIIQLLKSQFNKGYYNHVNWDIPNS